MLESSQARLGELEGQRKRLIAAYTAGALSLGGLAGQKAAIDKHKGLFPSFDVHVTLDHTNKKKRLAIVTCTIAKQRCAVGHGISGETLAHMIVRLLQRHIATLWILGATCVLKYCR